MTGTSEQDRREFLLECLRQALDMTRSNEQRVVTALGSYFGLLGVVAAIVTAGGGFRLVMPGAEWLYGTLFVIGAMFFVNILWWSRAGRDYMEVARRITLDWPVEQKHLPAFLRLHRGAPRRTNFTYRFIPLTVWLVSAGLLWVAIVTSGEGDSQFVVALAAFLAYAVLSAFMAWDMENWLNADRCDIERWRKEDLSHIERRPNTE